MTILNRTGVTRRNHLTVGMMRARAARRVNPAHLYREGYIGGFTGATRLDDEGLRQWVTSRGGRWDSRMAEAMGTLYAHARLMGAQDATEYPDATPERLAKVANSMWPAKTLFPRAMEAKRRAVLGSFKRMADDDSLANEIERDLDARLGEPTDWASAPDLVGKWY
ncbi:hypothetical protein UFOVP347_48 [uncultured Caudovirales phage]|uniref:Uncharacterized protein n=1 Tax=uncultured Caudovirales phage TaxID=2100421 RepID=A0A6J5M275_9CAUD|nr:hypothetical protein UFOVP347_48 [uncultured Caudovirales phage]